MTRLWDRIGRGVLDEWHATEPDFALESPVVFEVTNVADYYEKHSKDYLDPASFPNVAPPFGCFWMEWRVWATDRHLDFDRVGSLTVATTEVDPFRARWPNTPEDTKFGCMTFGMVEGRGRKDVQLCWTVYAVSDEGQATVVDEHVRREAVDLLVPPGREHLPRTPASVEADIASIQAREAEIGREGVLRELMQRREEVDRELHDATERYYDRATEALKPVMRSLVLYPTFMALSLMACKNVSTEDHTPPDRLSKRHRRKHGEPLVQFKTLVINTMGGGARSASGRHDLGDGVTAMHLVRGHFKTFTSERPLLGRHVGTYWWSPMVRGKAEQGLVVKDYEVRT